MQVVEWRDLIEELYVLLSVVFVALSCYFSFITWGWVSAIVVPIIVAMVMAIFGYFFFEYQP
jgi:membrane protein YdbS with pleckstrin-like domain